ncbi:MAG: glycosyltransferase [Thaumarchaeota archaeon]|nr:glycosyltransferase [Nitrososphaerota archaeon]
MRKVLIVTHLVRASPRIAGLAKYLPEFGWEPIVLTAPLDMGHGLGYSNRDTPAPKYRIVQIPYADSVSRLTGFLKKSSGFEAEDGVSRQSDKRFGSKSVKSRLVSFALKRFKEVVYYPDQDISMKKPVTKAGKQILQQEPVEVIISSSSPVTSHIIAKDLKKHHNLPWVADLRDLWSQNHNYPYGRLRRMVDRRLERRSLSTADALVTVSEPLVEQLKQIHKDKAIYPIYNGFDPDEFVAAKSLTAKFTVTYTGQIYPNKQDPVKLLKALKNVIADHAINPEDIEVRFYGYEEAWLTREIEAYGLTQVVKQYGQIPRKEAREKQRETQVLLLMNFEDPAERKAYISMKIFEYLAAKRPILLTGGLDGDPKEEMLKQTNSGVYTRETQEIEQALKTYYNEYKKKGNVTYTGNEQEINKYSYREMAKKFADILNTLVGCN